MDIKHYLKKRRKELHLTMKDVSEMVGVSESTISRWESGAISNMTRSNISSLSKALQISPSIIMGWTEEKSSPQREERTPGRERHQKYEEIFDLLEGLSESRTELALKGMLYIMNIPDDKLPEAVRYLQFLSENAEN